MDRWVTPPKRVTSPTWGPAPPCKQALLFASHQVPGHLFASHQIFNKRNYCIYASFFCVFLFYVFLKKKRSYEWPGIPKLQIKIWVRGGGKQNLATHKNRVLLTRTNTEQLATATVWLTRKLSDSQYVYNESIIKKERVYYHWKVYKSHILLFWWISSVNGCCGQLTQKQ